MKKKKRKERGAKKKKKGTIQPIHKRAAKNSQSLLFGTFKASPKQRLNQPQLSSLISHCYNLRTTLPLPNFDFIESPRNKYGAAPFTFLWHSPSHNHSRFLRFYRLPSFHQGEFLSDPFFHNAAFT